MREEIPSLTELGKDLLQVSPTFIYLSVLFPFLLTFGFFVFCLSGWWLMAFLCPVLLSFFTYGSISHDLVHRSLGLPRKVNEILLCATELLTLRSGHAYRASHLNHHAKFPAKDDLEGAAAGMTVLASLLDGLTLQYRIWYHSIKTAKADRQWIYGETIAIIVLIALSLIATQWTFIPFAYCALVIAGTWIFPFVTSWIPHNEKGDSELTRTRLFRGNLIRLIAMDHLYHLEHHLYPQVPHYRWPELARRLDPYFDKMGVVAIKIWF